MNGDEPANGNSVTRAELGMVMTMLKDVKEMQRILGEKIDSLMNGRVTWEAYDRHKDDCKKEMDRIKNRPSWTVCFILGGLLTISVTLTSLMLSGILH
jgi:hypothetical protein